MPGLNVRVRSRTRSSTGGAVTVRLRHLARGGLTEGLEAAVERGTRSADRHADRVARDWLPERGGFAGELARKSEVHRSKIPGGLRLTFDAKGTDVARINQGRLRRPLFGDREHWYTQTVRPGYADEALRRTKVDVDRELAEEMRNPRGR